jgi:hypothetical protein
VGVASSCAWYGVMGGKASHVYVYLGEMAGVEGPASLVLSVRSLLPAAAELGSAAGMAEGITYGDRGRDGQSGMYRR